MITLFSTISRGRRKSPPLPHGGFIMGGMVYAATLTIPVHGFVVGKKGLVSEAPASDKGFLGGWIGSILGACFWAAMMAGGMLIYHHYMKKWDEKGLPVLPVAAIANAAAQAQSAQPRSQGAIPLGSGSITPQATQQQQRGDSQISWLDEYSG